MGQPALEVADHRLAELDDAHGDAAAVHQFARQHEERDRHQRKAESIPV
jgi:hypothetical protein